MKPDLKSLRYILLEGKVTKNDVFAEWLRRDYDDVMSFPDYLEARSQVLEIEDE